jgi:hypothetical protein
MVMSLSRSYVEPGIFIKVQNVPAPNVVGGQFIPIFVGTGRKEYDVSANIVRSALDTKDLITEDYTVIDILSINDSFGNTYTKTTDYKLTLFSGGYYVDWNNPTTLTGSIDGPFNVNSKTLQINIDGTAQTITFGTADPLEITDVISEINDAFRPAIPASNDAGKLKLTGNTLVMIVNGTAMDDLGFVKGVNDKSESKRPDDGVTYITIYKRLKVKATEYEPHLFSRLEDLYAEHGAYSASNTIDIGDTAGTVTSSATNTLMDTVADYTGVSIGDYVKITGGTGKGQIRVITAVNSATFTLTIGDTWDDTLDGTSTYTIYDGPPVSEISIGATIAQTMGAVNFITSQSYDDIVDDNNIRLAINNTKELVNGSQGWCLVYLKGVDENDSIVSFIKQYLADMNNPLTKQERMALLGVKATTTDYTKVVTLTSGTLDRRIGIVANPFATITGIGQLDGSYIAAAISGIITNPNYDPGEPISGKALSVFDSVEDPYLRHEKRIMGGAGAIIIEKQGVDNKIVHYLSTKVDDIIDSELKVIKQEDDLKKTLRSTLQSALVNIRKVGTGKNVISIADSLVNLILSAKVDLTSIGAYKNLEIRFNPNEARELQISFLYAPTLDTNWVTITFGATVS